MTCLFDHTIVTNWKDAAKQSYSVKVRTFKILSKDDKVIIFLSILILNGNKLFFFFRSYQCQGKCALQRTLKLYFSFKGILDLEQSFWACCDGSNSSFTMTSQCWQKFAFEKWAEMLFRQKIRDGWKYF